MANSLLPHTINITERIFFIRGQRVMFDFDLALLYHVETRALKQAVRRNVGRFPDDFMFVLTKVEWQEVITNCDNLLPQKYSPALPMMFTEQGVAMLSSVLKSKRALQVNITIMRSFVQMRQLLAGNKELSKKIKSLEKKYDKQFKEVFDAIRMLIQQEANRTREKIGFRKDVN